MENYLKNLLDMQLPQKPTLYVNVTHIAKSGMSRRVKVYVAQSNRIINVTYHVANIIGYTLLNDDTIRIGGCGYNIADWLVRRASKELYDNDNSIDYGTM